MKPHVLFKLFCITMFVFVILAVATPTMAFQSSVGLFRDAAKMPAFDKGHDQAVVRTRYVDVNLDVLPGARGPAPAGSPVLLNLFDNRSVMAVLDHVERKPNGVVWVGSLQGINLSTVNIVAEDNVVVGSINYPGGMYVIRYAGNGVHAIQEIDQSQYPPEQYVPPSGPPSPRTYAPNPDVAPDSGGSIDVMVVFTPAFVTYAGGLSAANALVDLGVSQTNTSYANSGIIQRVNLVYKGQVSYTEPGTGADADWNTALNDVTNGTNGLGGVAALRNTYGADLVSLFAYWASPAYCGIGHYMYAVSSTFENEAFTVVQGNCVSSSFSFSHEMGHNMGADHDWYVSSGDPTPYTYAHGRVNLTAGWRTVMAYPTLCSANSVSCTRILYWSNPGLTYGGAPLGVAGGTNSNPTTCAQITNPSCDADNHLVLNNTALTVANFRQHIATGGVPTYLPIIQKIEPVAPGISGKLTQGGAPAGGITLSLRFWNGSSYSTAATTTTDGSGNFKFTGAPSLGAGQSYYVRYSNTENNSSRVSGFYSRDITSYTAGSSVDLGTSDLADITLSSPGGGATVTLPYAFSWNARGASPNDSYFMELFDYTDMNPYASTPLLGHVGGVTIKSIPTTFIPSTTYAWSVNAHDVVSGGDFYSYWARYIKFNNNGADLAGPFDVKPRLDQPRQDRVAPALQQR